MNRRHFLQTAGAVSLHAVPSPRPNVLVVLTDDQGYGDLAAGREDAAVARPNVLFIAIDDIPPMGRQFTPNDAPYGPREPRHKFTQEFDWSKP